MFLTRRDVLIGGGALGAAATFGRFRPAVAQDRPSMPIPAEIRADAGGNIHLTQQKGSLNLVKAGPTETFGVNGNYLGPTVRVRRGEKVTMKVTNALGQVTTMHWHGLKVPGEYDGSPHNIILPGDTWTAPLHIDQPAATYWYHPHPYPTTAELVLKGIAGLFVVDDDESDALALPNQWGVDDIPIILQDRRYEPDGSFFHRFNMAAIIAGYIGDTMLINGAPYPVAKTARGWLRLRILNGSNARTYRLKASDDRPLYVVAGDGSLLAEPVEVNELPIYAGERFEVMVDGRDGKVFDILTLPVEQLGMNLPPFHEPLALLTISPDDAETTAVLPDKLIDLEPLDANLPPSSQNLVMGMRLDDKGMAQFKEAGLTMGMSNSGMLDPKVVERVVKLIVDGQSLGIAEQLSANTVNDSSFQLLGTPFDAPGKQNLRWTISEGDDSMVHPVHIHGCQFRILSLNGAPPPAYQSGWKDMAPISNGGVCEIQVRFDEPAPANAPYMVHCHNLEHEDSGMMAQFAIV